MKRKWIVVTLATLITIAAIAFFIVSNLSEPSLESLENTEPVKGKIAFFYIGPTEPNKETPNEIWIMDANGSNPTRLCRGMSPAFSPDGKKIAFVLLASWTPGGLTSGGLALISARGGKPILIYPENNTRICCPAWSPDGKKIAFTIQPLTIQPIKGEYTGLKLGDKDIYVINADGSNLTRLTEEGGEEPCWSPDGKRIAFIRRGTIYTMNADGSNVTKFLEFPIYSEVTLPNGKRINIRVMRAEKPSWSPDGKKIAFDGWVSFEGGNPHYQIVVIDTDGNNLRVLTFANADSRWPSWSPDGKKIAFSSNAGNSCDIYVVDADGSNLTRLTDYPGSELFPTWSP
jgi:Tol biopolymer transport system component